MAVRTDSRGRHYKNDRQLARVGAHIIFNDNSTWFGTITELKDSNKNHIRVDWCRKESDQAVFDNQSVFLENHKDLYLIEARKPLIIIVGD